MSELGASWLDFYQDLGLVGSVLYVTGVLGFVGFFALAAYKLTKF